MKRLIFLFLLSIGLFLLMGLMVVSTAEELPPAPPSAPQAMMPAQKMEAGDEADPRALLLSAQPQTVRLPACVRPERPVLRQSYIRQHFAAFRFQEGAG